MNILTKFEGDWIRAGPCRVYSWFYSDFSDLNLGLAFIKINILTKFHEDWIKTVPSGVYSWFY